MKFEWDDRKNLINQEKHGVSFEEAREVFDEGEEIIRIISARKANTKERQSYEKC